MTNKNNSKKGNNKKNLQDTINNKGHLIDKSKLKKSIFKSNINLNTDIKCNEYFQPSIIPNNNNLINSKIKITKDTLFKTIKYKLNPTSEQKNILINYCYGYIDMYNSFVKLIKDKRKELMNTKNISNLRYVDMKYKPNLTQLKKDFNEEKTYLSIKYNINRHILDYALVDAIAMFKSIVSNQKRNSKLFSTMRYIKRTKNKKTFKVEKMICSENSFCASVLGKTLDITPKLNYFEECNKVYIIQYDSKKDQFLLLKRDPVKISSYITPYDVISIDPGVRTYLTGISENKIVEIGINIKNKINKVLNKIDTYKRLNKDYITNDYLSKKNKINNFKIKTLLEKDNISLFDNNTWNETLNNLCKYENLNNETIKIYNRKKQYQEDSLKKTKLSNNKTRKLIDKQDTYLTNYINDVQWKIADYLSVNYNNVIIGDLSTYRMRKTHSNDLAILKRLGMYKLREKIKYKCILRKRKFIIINESYTTKCCINCAKENNIGTAKIYTCKFCNNSYDRDIKASGLIYLKALI